jgi:hypothetical protein
MTETCLNEIMTEPTILHTSDSDTEQTIVVLVDGRTVVVIAAADPANDRIIDSDGTTYTESDIEFNRLSSSARTALDHVIANI